jgi:MFS family permease
MPQQQGLSARLAKDLSLFLSRALLLVAVGALLTDELRKRARKAPRSERARRPRAAARTVAHGAPAPAPAAPARQLGTPGPGHGRIAAAAENPLHSGTFVRLATGYTVNELGNWVGDVALAILVFDQTHSALATAALFLALRFLPAILGPLLTSRVEALPVRRILPAIQGLEGLIFLAIAWLARNFSLPVVLVLGALDGALAVAAGALTRGATAALLPSEGMLRRGNAILNMGFSVGGAVGPACAGVLVAALGPSAALVVDAATFFTVAAILASASGLRLETSGEARWFGRLRAGIGEAWSRPGVRRLLIAQALALVFFTAVIPIEVVYAKRTLHAGDSGYGALLGAWGAGMVAGGLAYAAANRIRLLVVLATATALIGIGYGGIAVATTLPVACAFSAIGGIGNGAQWIGVVTATQQSISATAQSSVMSLLGALNQVMPGIGFLLGGILATVGSPRTTYGAAAIGVFVALALVAMRPPQGLGVRPAEADGAA